MIDGFLFLLITINFSITFILLIRYSKNKKVENEIKQEMTEMINQFNQNAERNIQLLEDKIQKAKACIKPNEITKVQTIQKKMTQEKDEKIQVAHDLLSKIKSKRNQLNSKNKVTNKNQGQGYTSPSLGDMKKLYSDAEPSVIKNYSYQSPVVKANGNTNNQSLAYKTFIQKAYSPSKPKLDDEIQAEPISNTMPSMRESQEIEDNHPLGDADKPILHQIAKLIGEGRSFEEISTILELSMGEIQLLTSLVRKKLLQKN